MAALFKAREPEDAAFDCFANGQQPVVREDGRLLLPQGFSDVLPFLWPQNDATEAIVEREVVVEGAAILRGDLQSAPERRECPSVNRMAMCYSIYVGPCRMDGGMDHIGYVLSVGVF